MHKTVKQKTKLYINVCIKYHIYNIAKCESKVPKFGTRGTFWDLRCKF